MNETRNTDHERRRAITAVVLAMAVAITATVTVFGFKINKWNSEFARRAALVAHSRLMGSLVFTTEKFISDNGRLPASRSELAKAIEVQWPDQLDDDRRSDQLMERSILFQKIAIAPGDRHYEWMFVVVIPAEGKIDQDFICYGGLEAGSTDKYINSSSMTTVKEARLKFGNAVVDAAYAASKRTAADPDRFVQ